MIEFRLLGPVEARDGAGAVGLGPAQRRGLLAMLLLEAGRPVPVERLVEGLWGAAAPGSARKMVQAHVSALRKRLGAEAVRTAGGGYAATARPEQVDAFRFEAGAARGRRLLAAGEAERAAEALREALALWRGPALAGLEEPFAELERARLEELRLAATEDRVEADLALGRHASLPAELERLILAQEPRLAAPAPSPVPSAAAPPGGPTRYADNGGVGLAYRVFCEGEEELALVTGWVLPMELAWDEPAYARFLDRLGRGRCCCGTSAAPGSPTASPRASGRASRSGRATWRRCWTRPGSSARRCSGSPRAPCSPARWRRRGRSGPAPSPCTAAGRAPSPPPTTRSAPPPSSTSACCSWPASTGATPAACSATGRRAPPTTRRCAPGGSGRCGSGCTPGSGSPGAPTAPPWRRRPRSAPAPRPARRCSPARWPTSPPPGARASSRGPAPPPRASPASCWRSPTERLPRAYRTATWPPSARSGKPVQRWPRRSAADGLRVFPAPLPGRGMVAALWVPHGEAGPERAWAALDCPAIWALIAAARPGSPDRIVTGTMPGELRAELVPGEPYVAYAWVEGAAGRRRMTGAALADARGEVVAVNHQVFVTVAAGVPLDPRRWRLP